jgi:E3 ubiquitin-protein ligase UHRF1
VYTGAVSVVLSGGLKQDRDDGYEFVFSGGGGDLKIRHRMKVEGQMTEDQQLTRYNKALAITCNAPLNDIEGAKAVDWRKSRPIRVCRAGNRKCTHPTYAPEEGIRYDGLYKIVKYWPHRGKLNLLQDNAKITEATKR